jgi:hypothetical protein
LRDLSRLLHLSKLVAKRYKSRNYEWEHQFIICDEENVVERVLQGWL